LLNVSASATVRLTANIHITDSTGAAIEAATVTLTSYGNIVSNDAGSSFYRCIADHTSGVFANDLSSAYWELTTAANAALAGVTGVSPSTGAWVTGIDYTKSAEEFSELTDSNGDIAEQTETYKKWVGTSEALLSYSPHYIKMVKLTYISLTVNNVVLDSPIKYVFELQDYLEPGDIVPGDDISLMTTGLLKRGTTGTAAGGASIFGSSIIKKIRKPN